MQVRSSTLTAVFTALPLLLLGTVLISASLGQFEIPLPQVAGGILRNLGLASADPAMQLADATLWNIRLPRILLGLLVGAALGASGALMQAVFGNPLAEPGVIGISAGAAVGACRAIVLGMNALGMFTVPLCAFAYALATSAPIVGVGIIGSFLLARQLNLLALGERAAAHSGVHVERLRLAAIVCTALLTGAAVAYAGIIAFVDLIVPHLLRMVVGPSNRVLLPASALGGALLIAASDLAARTLVSFADLPIGIFTALVGGPTFFILLRRTLTKGAL
ncbi:FecCD family ABC transporter permease [Rothia nasimurium]|uniref:FecCD family ABC transporter permease n=1 Tax=Rothia nasimurium TaxID=85336 RepID=UPI001F16C80E|nr:iron ABC transporter permease [Rothia nasimurium]